MLVNLGFTCLSKIIILIEMPVFFFFVIIVEI